MQHVVPLLLLPLRPQPGGAWKVRSCIPQIEATPTPQPPRHVLLSPVVRIWPAVCGQWSSDFCTAVTCTQTGYRSDRTVLCTGSDSKLKTRRNNYSLPIFPGIGFWRSPCRLYLAQSKRFYCRNQMFVLLSSMWNGVILPVYTLYYFV